MTCRSATSTLRTDPDDDTPWFYRKLFDAVRCWPAEEPKGEGAEEEPDENRRKPTATEPETVGVEPEIMAPAATGVEPDRSSEPHPHRTVAP